MQTHCDCADNHASSVDDCHGDSRYELSRLRPPVAYRNASAGDNRSTGSMLPEHRGQGQQAVMITGKGVISGLLEL